MLACEVGQSICDKSSLTPAQAREAGKANDERNLLACKVGEGYCDDSLLSHAEAKAVAEARRRRNALACEAGEISCDRSLWNANEAKQNNGKPSSCLLALRSFLEITVQLGNAGQRSIVTWLIAPESREAAVCASLI